MSYFLYLIDKFVFMDYIEIKGYKSIREAKVELTPINILIGANGSGKSNFISFFEFLNRLYNQNLKEYIALNGGSEKILHHGAKSTLAISSYISFDNQVNAYSFTINNGADGFVFTKEDLWYYSNPWEIAQFGSEARVKTDGKYRARYVRNHLNGFKKYHFHDTGKNSPFNQTSNIENDIYFLYEKGSNLAAFLYSIQQNNQVIYGLIVKTIQSIAPYFSDFYLQPNAEGHIRLQWQDKYSSVIYGASDLSDGTIRFIALTTLFMQPVLPASIIIDEPELGLHPFAIAKLAGMIQSASAKGTQVIVATQSADLVNHFDPDAIITVDQVNGESVFNRLQTEELSVWLEDYSIGDLWQRNILEGGQP
jgi:predicted ATPase